MPPAKTSEASVHELLAAAVNVFEEAPANEVVVVQIHEDALRGDVTPADVGGILADAGVPMGEPIFVGDKPPIGGGTIA